MSHVYNPEADLMGEIERLELEAKAILRKIEQTPNENDKRVLNRQLKELKDEIEQLQKKLP